MKLDITPEAIAQAGARVGLVGGVTADDRAAVDRIEDAPLLRVERMGGLAQQAQGEIGERELCHRGRPRVSVIGSRRNGPIGGRQPRGALGANRLPPAPCIGQTRGQ